MSLVSWERALNRWTHHTGYCWRPCELGVEGQSGARTGWGRSWAGHSFGVDLGEVVLVRTPRPGISVRVVSGS